MMRDFQAQFVRCRTNLSLIILGMLFLGAYIQTRRPNKERLNLFNSRSDAMTSESEKEELTEDTFVGRHQEDPNLVVYIRRHEMHDPSILPYNLTEPNRKDFSQFNQSFYAVEHFLHGMTDGFFIEAGASDGETLSNTLFFEKYRSWRGLLVEPDPKRFEKLTKRHRKAYLINAGFSLNEKSGTANFGKDGEETKITDKDANGITIKTFPIYSMLLALGVSQVDFFSLDIEGDEKNVLDTIPWDKIKFRLICMEINKYKGGRSAYVRYFEELGYTYLGNHDIDAWFGLKELLQETMDVDDWLVKNAYRIVV